MHREVTMLEVKEVLRLWREGVPTKRLAAQLGLDPKTVRRYLRAAAAAGVRADGVVTPYDIPLWSEPMVARDQVASIGKATYSMPPAYVGQVITARADSHLVRFHARGLLTKIHRR